MSALTFHAGPLALDQIRAHGLRARDIAVVPAAAGGPKGLIFRSLDQWVFGEWFPSAPRERTLIGSSIGAWRMAAACQKDPVKAFERLGELYSGQRYTSTKPSQEQIDEVVQGLLKEFVRGHEDDIVNHPQHRLHLLTVRGKRALAAPGHRYAEMKGFAAAALHNLASRDRLAQLMDRVVIGDVRSAAGWLRETFDNFSTHFSPLTRDNLASGLLASGTLPMLMKPVRDIAGAPPGHYWDGGIIDYNLALPYARLTEQDQGDCAVSALQRAHRAGLAGQGAALAAPARGPNRGWLDNVLIVAPSPEFLGKLPRGKLIDRSDFKYYGLNHDARILAWKQAMDEGERLRDEFASFVDKAGSVAYPSALSKHLQSSGASRGTIRGFVNSTPESFP
jgi:predicted acylesterase/phospholipase RssA